MLKKYLKRIKRVTIGMYRWQIYKEKLSPEISSQEKNVYFDLSENKFERYLYLFVKFFLLEGYSVHFKRNFHFIGDLEYYSLWLLKEEGVFFCKSKPVNTKLSISDCSRVGDISISYDYFSSSTD